MQTSFAIAILAATVQGTERVITFQNYCNEPIWFGFAGGSTQNVQHTNTQCGSDSDCYSGSKCIQTGDIKQCFFQNPFPSDKNFKLLTGVSKDISIPMYDNGSDVIWSGAITGKAGCDSTGGNCRTADCGVDSNGSCIASRGFS